MRRSSGQVCRNFCICSGRRTRRKTCLAFNTAQVYRSRAGERLAKKGIRRLRREQRRALGAAPVVVYVAGCYAVLAVEELLAALGRPVQESLLPFGGRARTETPKVPP